MEKLTLANRLSIRIMAVLIVMSTAIMLLVYFITRQSTAREAESRYESVILNAINNINDIESDIDDPDKLQIHLERMVNQHVYVELQSREIDALRNAFNDMQASLVIAVARSMFRSASMQYTSPKQIVESINRSVCQSIVYVRNAIYGCAHPGHRQAVGR